MKAHYSGMHRLRNFLRRKITRIPENILCDRRNESGSMGRAIMGTTVVLYGYVPVMYNGVLLIIKKESSKSRGRRNKNLTLLYTAF